MWHFTRSWITNFTFWSIAMGHIYFLDLCCDAKHWGLHKQNRINFSLYVHRFEYLSMLKLHFTMLKMYSTVIALPFILLDSVGHFSPYKSQTSLSQPFNTNSSSHGTVSVMKRQLSHLYCLLNFYVPLLCAKCFSYHISLEL